MAIVSSRTHMLNIQEARIHSGGSQYEMVLIAAMRAREIAYQDPARENLNASIEALLELQEGHVGRHYLNKLYIKRKK